MTPRPAPRWPPVLATASTVSVRSSSASCRSCSADKFFKSLGKRTRSSSGVLDTSDKRSLRTKVGPRFSPPRSRSNRSRLTPNRRFRAIRGPWGGVSGNGGHALGEALGPAADKIIVIRRAGPLVGQQELEVGPEEAPAAPAEAVRPPQVAETDGDHGGIAARRTRIDAMAGDGVERPDVHDVVPR